MHYIKMTLCILKNKEELLKINKLLIIDCHRVKDMYNKKCNKFVYKQ